MPIVKAASKLRVVLLLLAPRSVDQDVAHTTHILLNLAFKGAVLPEQVLAGFSEHCDVIRNFFTRALRTVCGPQVEMSLSN